MGRNSRSFLSKLFLSEDKSLNPIRLEGWLRGPDAKNQGYHQLIEIKLYMSQYSHKSMPDAQFESGSVSRFGDIT